MSANRSIRIGSDSGVRSRIQRTNRTNERTQRTITVGDQVTAVDVHARIEIHTSAAPLSRRTA